MRSNWMDVHVSWKLIQESTCEVHNFEKYVIICFLNNNLIVYILYNYYQVLKTTNNSQLIKILKLAKNQQKMAFKEFSYHQDG